jgi:hypothetical protein
MKKERKKERKTLGFKPNCRYNNPGLGVRPKSLRAWQAVETLLN